ncbi:MAG: nuclear transport factor 2 family protein [Actinomycetota bacterium]
MGTPAAALLELGKRYGEGMNARDFDSVAELFAADAVYVSDGPPFLTGDRYGRRLSGRDEIITYFREVFAGDFEFVVLDHYVGVDMLVTLSSMGGRTFVDVFRVGEDGLISELLDVVPKRSRVDFTQSDSQV